MEENSISLKNLAENILFDVIVNIIVTGLVGKYINVYLGLVVFFAYWVGVIYFRKYNRRFKLLKSGLEGYYYSFPLDENPKIWKQVRYSFKYLGISSDSILEPFRAWINSLAYNDPKDFKFLLMDPQAKALKSQICHEKGYDLNTLSPEQEKEIQDEIDAVQDRINSAVKILKNTRHYKDGHLKIKFYDEFIPWWIYIFDDEKVFLGILKKGERSSNAPLLIMARNKHYTSIFDAFLNYWNSMWENAKDV